MDDKTDSSAQRVKAHRDRLKAKGLAQCNVTAPIDQHGKIRDMAKQLCDAHSGEFEIRPEIEIPDDTFKDLERAAQEDVGEILDALRQILAGGSNKTFARLNRSLKIILSEHMPDESY